MLSACGDCGARGPGGKHDKGGSEGRDMSGSQKQEGSGSQCGRPGHFARDKNFRLVERFVQGVAVGLIAAG